MVDNFKSTPSQGTGCLRVYFLYNLAPQFKQNTALGSFLAPHFPQNAPCCGTTGAGGAAVGGVAGGVTVAIGVGGVTVAGGT